MTDLTFDDPCLVFALGREASAFRRTFRPNQTFPVAPCPARFCGPAGLSVLVLETGMGADRAAAALEWALSSPLLGNVPYRPRLVLSAGFSGALREDCRVGDVILATELVTPDGPCLPATWPGELPAGPWNPPLHRGRLLTAPGLVASPEEKRRLGERHEAAAVDMETATVAGVCTRRGVPFGCVRVISDDVNTPLSPQLAGLLAGGRVSPWRVLAALARRPRLAGELWRLARHTRLAAEQLAKALGELLRLTLGRGGASAGAG